MSREADQAASTIVGVCQMGIAVFFLVKCREHDIRQTAEGHLVPATFSQIRKRVRTVLEDRI